MRFGIMAMQIDYLIPEDKVEEGSSAWMTHVLNLDHAALVAKMVQHGFSLIELGGDLAMLLPHTFASPSIQKLAELKEENGLSYTLHLPLWSVEPSTMLSQVRNGSVLALIENIQATLPLQPEMYVLHATGELAAEFYLQMKLPPLARAFLMRQFQNGARQSIQTLLTKTAIPSRKLALETVAFPFELTLELAEEFDLSICLDTGHVLAGFSGEKDVFEVLELALPRLGEVHLHDSPWQGVERNIAFGKDHRPLGEGDLDVARFLDRLVEANFKGPVIFELRLSEALQSLNYIRQVRPDVLTSDTYKRN